MKKFLLSLVISGASVCAFAQPTMDFDTPAPSWTGSGTSIEPTGWISENLVDGLPGNSQSVFKDSTNAHGGQNAMKVTSIHMGYNPAPTTLPNPIGLAATGNFTTTLKIGFPNTSRPTTVSFWYEYAPAANDSAEFLIAVWNGGLHDTLATGFWKTGDPVSAYTQQNVTLNYNPAYSSIFPDSMALIFSSTKLFAPNYKFCLTCGTAGSTLWVDDITFSGWDAVNETQMSKGVTMFPNPASDFTTITVEDVNEASLVEVFDITGRSITSMPFSQSSNTVNKKSAAIATHEMSAGIYVLSVYDKNKHLLRNGKLNVVK